MEAALSTVIHDLIVIMTFGLGVVFFILLTK